MSDKLQANFRLILVNEETGEEFKLAGNVDAAGSVVAGAHRKVVSAREWHDVRSKILRASSVSLKPIEGGKAK